MDIKDKEVKLNMNNMFIQYIKQSKEISLIHWLNYCKKNMNICIEDKNRLTNVYKDGSKLLQKKMKSNFENIILTNFDVSFYLYNDKY
jgi:hypothetical protein